MVIKTNQQNRQQEKLALSSIQAQIGALSLLGILYNLVFKNKAPKPQQRHLEHTPSVLTSLFDAYKWFERSKNTQIKANRMNPPKPSIGP